LAMGRACKAKPRATVHPASRGAFRPSQNYAWGYHTVEFRRRRNGGCAAAWTPETISPSFVLAMKRLMAAFDGPSE